MKVDYNTYFLKHEAEIAHMQMALKTELEKQVEEQLGTQMEAVCAFMRPRLIASWEKGGFGENILGEVYISIPKGLISKTYEKTLNAVVRELLFEYGFLVYFNCTKDEKPEIAKVQFNFTTAFYENRNDWCSAVAHEYMDAKVLELVNTLQQVVYLHNLSCSQGEESPFENKVEMVVKLPPAARNLIASRVCAQMGNKLNNYSLDGRDRIIFYLA